MTQVIRKICFGAIVGAIVGTMAVGCATVEDPGQKSFLSDYSKLVKIEENFLIYSEGNIGRYSKFIIEPVAMLYDQPEEKRVFDDEELEDLQAYFAIAIREALIAGDGYEVVEEPGPETAILRLGITDVNDTIGVLNFIIYTKITGAGLGGVAMEGEVLDSLTGEQIGAAIRWGSGSRILRAGFTHTGDAKIVIKKWAKDLREIVDKAHGP
jgi:hypothetical protein